MPPATDIGVLKTKEDPVLRAEWEKKFLGALDMISVTPHVSKMARLSEISADKMVSLYVSR
jgi:hypothetical protein